MQYNLSLKPKDHVQSVPRVEDRNICFLNIFGLDELREITYLVNTKETEYRKNN